MSEPKSIANIIRAEASLAVLALDQLWPRIVGAWIAEHAHPVSFRRGLLTVATDSPALSQELHFEQQEILNRLNEALGGEMIMEMRFKVGSRPRPGRPKAGLESPPPQPRPPDSKLQARWAEEVAAVADEELREILLRLRLKAALGPGGPSRPTSPGKTRRG